MKNAPSNIIISRTDSIGDVVLTLPMAGVIKRFFPSCKVAFMGKAYTRAVIETCSHVDEFIDVEDFLTKEITVCGEKPACIVHVFPVSRIAARAKALGVPVRIGTTNRLFHWWTCNKLVRLSRKNSDLHEAQLNFMLLKPLGIDAPYSLEEMGRVPMLTEVQPLPDRFRQLLQKDKFNLILHPKSQGNGREWPLEHYIELINLLPADRFHIFISGTAKERAAMDVLFERVGDKVTDLTGAMTLAEFISFIQAADGLIASGTGPVHMAAALGIHALGIYPPIRPIHPGRWAPIGPKAQVFVMEKRCEKCKGNDKPCDCIQEVPAIKLSEALKTLG